MLQARPLAAGWHSAGCIALHTASAHSQCIFSFLIPAPPPSPPPQDAKLLFSGTELTAKEKADLAYKQQLYDLAMEKRKTAEKIKEEGYHMPDSYDEPEKRDERLKVGAGHAVRAGVPFLASCCIQGLSITNALI